MRIFAGEWVKNVLTRLGMEEGQAIESKMVSRRIEGAQKKVEERNFEVRKNLLEYDEVMDEQRKRTYGYRQNILEGTDCKALILDMVDKQIVEYMNRFMARDYNETAFAAFASSELAVDLNARDFRNMNFLEACSYAKSEADRLAEGMVMDSISENLPDDAEEDEWNWEALTRSINTRWRCGIRERDLKKIGPEMLDEFLVEKVRQAIDKVDLSRGEPLLDPNYGRRSAVNWIKVKFDIPVDFDQIKSLELNDFIELVRTKAIAAYRDKEVKFPVMAGLVHATSYDSMGSKHYDRELILEWVKQRYNIELSLDDLRNKQRQQVEEMLLDISRSELEKADKIMAEAKLQVKDFLAKFGKSRDGAELYNLDEAGRKALLDLEAVFKSRWDVEMNREHLHGVHMSEFERRVLEFVEDRYRPEMRKLERALVLQIVDSGWKKHLLVMDHLRSSVGLRGYAQVDPKVEFKREGMRAFEELWKSVGEQVTNVIYRMEQQVDERFLGAVWSSQTAVHEQSGNTASSMANQTQQSDIGRQQQEAIDNTQSGEKKEPIRRSEAKIGRNDLCPCGSGKKYKKCCGRDQ